jgi:hypothetical protein
VKRFFDMPTTSAGRFRLEGLGGLANWGTFWLAVATVAAAFFFSDGIDALLRAWSVPEYSHGPLIPVLSLLLFLRQLKSVPENPGPVRDRWVGVVVVAVALAVATMGKLANIDDIVIYATIIWVGGILLISFGWNVGKHFWPPVLHLVYMLPLPGHALHQDDEPPAADLVGDWACSSCACSTCRSSCRATSSIWAC